MLVVEGSEEFERSSVGVTRIEEDDFVPTGAVVFLVAVQETARTEIGIDVADAIKEDIGTDEAVVNFADVLHDPVMDILHELV